jgi:hypothetical protein
MRNVATATRHLARLAGDDSRISFEEKQGYPIEDCIQILMKESFTSRSRRMGDLRLLHPINSMKAASLIRPAVPVSLLEELVQKKILHSFQAGQPAIGVGIVITHDPPPRTRTSAR